MARAAVAKIGRAIRADISRVVGGMMLRAENALENATPVDTTHASTNWILSLRRPVTTVDGSRESPSRAAQQAGIAAVMKYDVGRDGSIFLRNNVFYLQYLNKGSSQQAPAGFVETCFMEAARGVPYGQRGAAKKMLRGLARAAYRRGY